MSGRSRIVGASVAFLGLVVLAACGAGVSPRASGTSSPTTSPSAALCATATARASAQDGLPVEVAAIRERIVQASAACDFDRLETLARAGSPSFTVSFGEKTIGWQKGELARSLAQADALDKLVAVLDLPYAKTRAQLETDKFSDLYVWPSAFRDGATDADWEAVEGIYTKAEIANMKAAGGYVGWRAGITPEGDWIFFVAGD